MAVISIITCVHHSLLGVNKMNKKLEARITKLEKALKIKNEQRSRKESEMSPAEIEAYRAVKPPLKP